MSRFDGRPRARPCLRSILLSLAALGALALTAAPSHSAASARADNPAAPAAAPRFAALPLLRQAAQDDGTVRVIVELDVPFVPEGELPSEAKVEDQQENIGDAQDELLDSLAPSGGKFVAVETFEAIPYVVLEVDAAGLQALAENPAVADIQQDIPSPPLLTESTHIIGADAAWAAGYTGAGQVVAILDTGVDKTHTFLSGKVVAEACFSTTSAPYGSTSLCPSPDGNGDQIGADSALNCSLGMSGCEHGTHVAGIAAGKGGSFSGVAKDAGLLSIQVFSRFDGAQCSGFGMPSPCVLSWTSDQLAALDWLLTQKDTYALAAANMSLGGGLSDIPCDDDFRKDAIDNLRSVGIATVVASGNMGSHTSLASPACISSAVSVGATTDSDQVAAYSNVAPFLSLLAPGSSIESSVPGDAYQTMTGTSMAAPHVAGAFAVLKALKPTATIDELLNVLDSTGRPISREFPDGSTVGPFSRIQLKLAADALLPPLTSSFEDVAIDYWAYPYIEALYQSGFVAGCSVSPRLYCPDLTLSRAEAAVFVERGIHDLSFFPAIPTMQVFADLPLESWAAKWATVLLEDGYTAGCGTGPLIYCPWQGNSRAEASVFFLHMLHGKDFTPPQPPVSAFSDVPVDSWYAKWVNAAYADGLLPACHTTPLQFCPGDALDRSWAAYMMAQAKGMGLPTVAPPP